MEETHEQHKLHGFMQCGIYLSVALETAIFVYLKAPFWGFFYGPLEKLSHVVIYRNLLYSKLATLLLICLVSIGTLAKKKQELDPKKHIIYPLALGLASFFGSAFLYGHASDLVFACTTWYNLAYMVCSLFGAILISVSMDNVSKMIRSGLGKDIWNVEGESFMQPVAKVVTPYSVNIPMQFYYKGKVRDGWINIVNPFRGTLLIGTPGSGKSFGVVNPVSGEKKLMFDKINRTLEAATGGSLHDLDDRLIFRIDNIDLFDFPAYELSRDLDAPIKVPMITYSFLNEATGKEAQDSVFFGKYFIYEGLAHHLDQLVTRQLNRPLTPKRLVKPEYKLLELIARYYFPGIDERSMLELASMSLCYFNCGHRFIRMIEEAANVPYLPGFVMDIHNEVYDHFKAHEEEIRITLEEIKTIFAKRAGMYAAASHLCDVMMNAYRQRIKRPTFEIDITYSGHLKEMRSFVDLCDMVYELADEDKYMRDYAGTYLPNQLASDLQIFLCHVDYFQTSVTEVEAHCCPLYTFCPHRIRQEKPEQCAKTPRLAYEDHQEYGWCHYGRGVAYMTGQDVA